MSNKWLILLFAVAIVFWVAWIYATVQVHRNCDHGHVVKNQFDWPVCVEAGD